MYWNTYVQVASDFTTDGTTNQQSVTGLTFAASANTKYEIEVVLLGQSSTSAGLTMGINFSAAGATGTHIAIGQTSAAGTVAAGSNLIGTLQGIFWAVATTDLCTCFKGIVIIGANSGNITVDVKKTTSGTATIRSRSVMKIKKL